MFDIIGDPRDLGSDSTSPLPCLVFEWMDHTFQNLSPSDHRQNTALFRAVFKAGLNTLATLGDQKLVDTGTCIGISVDGVTHQVI